MEHPMSEALEVTRELDSPARQVTLSEPIGCLDKYRAFFAA
jgi:hypothetical protein